MGLVRAGLIFLEENILSQILFCKQVDGNSIDWEAAWPSAWPFERLAADCGGRDGGRDG